MKIKVKHPSGWTAFKVVFKKTPRSRDIIEWEFFAPDKEAFIKMASKKLNVEYYGRAKIISVEPTIIYKEYLDMMGEIEL